ncbi:MAG: hypothetical protein K2M95_02380 [Clostridiales bacterium]|nr:hypothetical protein [Clostridiales bacterium]
MEPYGFNGSLTPADIAWLLFSETGEPGMYMLYSELRKDKERSIFD